MAFTAPFFLGLLTLSQAFVLEKNQPRIVNGEAAKPGEIPYQVSLQTLYDFHFCGGSILNENYVITAAHCVNGTRAHSIKIVADTLDLRKPQSEHYVSKVIMHENYNSNWSNDIALIKVNTPFVKSKQMSFIHLPEPELVVNNGDVGVVSGWGRLYGGGPSTDILQRVNVYIVDQTNCAKLYKDIGKNIFDSQICAHDENSMKGSCQGDSGGPLTIGGKLVGLVSWAKGCASTTYPTVYTRVTSYLDWIKENAV